MSQPMLVAKDNDPSVEEVETPDEMAGRRAGQADREPGLREDATFTLERHSLSERPRRKRGRGHGGHILLLRCHIFAPVWDISHLSRARNRKSVGSGKGVTGGLDSSGRARI